MSSENKQRIVEFLTTEAASAFADGDDFIAKTLRNCAERVESGPVKRPRKQTEVTA